MAKSLDSEDIWKTFGGIRALAGVGISVGEGELVGLIGPNGSGKSTFVNCVTGYYKPDKGRVLLMGRDITVLPPYKIFRLGVARTFQTPQFYLDLNAIQHLRLATLWNSNKQDEGTAFKRTLDMLDLTSRATVPARELSHFEQRKLEIATRVVSSPKFLLLDEPVAGLSPEEIDALLAILIHLNKSGLGILIIEHTMNVIFRLCQKVVVMNQGKMIATGTPKEIMSDLAVIEAYLGSWKPEK